jgi:hypothetical protein
VCESSDAAGLGVIEGRRREKRGRDGSAERGRRKKSKKKKKNMRW